MVTTAKVQLRKAQPMKIKKPATTNCACCGELGYWKQMIFNEKAHEFFCSKMCEEAFKRTNEQLFTMKVVCYNPPSLQVPTVNLQMCKCGDRFVLTGRLTKMF